MIVNTHRKFFVLGIVTLISVTTFDAMAISEAYRAACEKKYPTGVCDSKVRRANYVNKVDMVMPDGRIIPAGTLCKGFSGGGFTVSIFTDKKENDGTECNMEFSLKKKRIDCNEFLKSVKGCDAPHFLKSFEFEEGKIYDSPENRRIKAAKEKKEKEMLKELYPELYEKKEDNSEGVDDPCLTFNEKPTKEPTKEPMKEPTSEEKKRVSWP